jgi:hypothetical protein
MRNVLPVQPNTTNSDQNTAGCDDENRSELIHCLVFSDLGHGESEAIQGMLSMSRGQLTPSFASSLEESILLVSKFIKAK